MNTHDAMIPFLKAVPYFADLSPAVLATVATHCRPKSLRRGKILFMEGDPCQDLYILESGRVKCYRANAGGREQILKVFDRPGDAFCIPSVFCTGRHIVTAEAVTEIRLCLIDREAALRLAGEHPSVALKLIATAGEHMKHLVALAEDLSLKTATSRLAKLLYERAVAEGVRNGRKVQLRRDCLPEEEIASMIGAVRVHVSRSLQNLVRAGLLSLKRGVIHIHDLMALKQLSEGNDPPNLKRQSLPIPISAQAAGRYRS